tara:strand:+ start:53038 stop:53958 length:921 start_codon:yes stop_codon:yes gene_type:complete
MHLAIILSAFLCAQSASATTVRVITSLGDFSIELLDNITPITVANFLNYVNSGRYNGTVIHRSIVTPSPFIIQGGWLSYNAADNTLSSINTDATIQNEPGITNLRGTVAMAKLAGDPNSATSQWFVNLDDNSENLDAQNGGFTVFGRVIGDGMTVVDNIAAQSTFVVNGVAGFPNGLSDFPLINVTNEPLGLSNFVNVAIVAAPAPNYFDADNGLLHLTVDAGATGLLSVVFSIVADEPNIVAQLDFDSLAVLTQTVDNMASFDEVTGRLIVPELYMSGEPTFRNMNLILNDPELFQFTLESFEEI